MATLCSVNPDDIPAMWHDIRDGVVQTLERYAHGDWHERDVLVALLTEQAQLWTYGDTFCVTRFADFPRRRVLEIFLLFGNGRDLWLPLTEALAVYARSKGASQLLMTGREGWGKVLDWDKTHIELRRNV